MSIASRLRPTGYQPVSRIDIRYLDDTIFLTGDGAYTVVRIPTVAWDMASQPDRVLMAYDLYRALSLLPRGDDHLHRIITTSHRFSADRWMEECNDWTTTRLNPGPGWFRQTDSARQFINTRQHPMKMVYLVIRLGDRGTHDGRLAWFKNKIGDFVRAVDLDDDMPSLAEIESWRSTASSYRLQLRASPSHCEPVDQHEMEMCLRRLTHPGLPVPNTYSAPPERYGPGDITPMLGGLTEIVDLGRVGENVYDCVKHTTQTGTTYQLWFVMSNGPAKLTFPSVVWLNQAVAEGIDLHQAVGFQLRRRSSTEKEADAIIDQTGEQRYMDSAAGASTDLSILEKEALAKQMKYDLEHKAIGVWWRGLFGISHPDPEVLREHATLFQQAMSDDANVTVEAPPNAQRHFFYEALPGSRPIENEYIRKTQLTYLAVGMPHISAALGDMTGPFRGYSIAGGRRSEPVFTEHLAYATGVGQKAPVEGVFGISGTGKTVSCGINPVAIDARRKVTQAVIDPRGDYTVLKHSEEELDIEKGTIRCLNVLDGVEGMFDPASLATDDEDGDVAEIMRTTIRRMLPRMIVAGSNAGMIIEDLVSQAVDQAVQEGNTYLIRVIEIFEEWETNDQAEATSVIDQNKVEYSGRVARRLRDLATTRLGKTVFASKPQPPANPVGKTTIFCTLGLNNPDPGSDPLEWSDTQIMSDIIFGLMVDYVWAVMTRLPRNVPKVITWDEFHLYKNNQRITVMNDRMKRLGRYHWLNARYISQFAYDLDLSHLTAVYSFGDETEDGQKAACEALHIRATPEAMSQHAVLAQDHSPKGRCIHRDQVGNVGVMDNVIEDPRHLAIFDTNPERQVEIVRQVYGESAAVARQALEEV